MLERDIEDRLIKQLISLGYERITFSKDFSIKDNLRNCLNKLNSKAYSEEDIEQIVREINLHAEKTGGSYAYTFNKFMDKGLRVTLHSDSSGKDKKDTSDIRLFDKRNVNNNIFQVANQIIDNDGVNVRYDVTILINGFPLVQIELKKPDVEIDNAINQINRYINTAYKKIFKFIQIFVVSNGIDTKYGVNNNENLNKLFMFRWSDDVNNHIIDIEDFTDKFLNKNNLFEMLVKYTIRYTTTNRLIVLRPYQVYAIKKAIDRVNTPEIKPNHMSDGYIFHATGSGKTLTSWKCVQLISELPNVSKVIFLVDRRDLDSQTSDEFRSIDSGLDVDSTDSTEQLCKEFKERKFTITTIQKLYKAIKKAETEEKCLKEWQESHNNGKKPSTRYLTTFNKYKKARVAIIVDECHRSQDGDMHSAIYKFFTNTVSIGFTGTPIVAQNRGNGCLTQDLFGREIHSYKIVDAIHDKSILPFNVQYYKTLRGNKLLESEDKVIDTKKNKIDFEEALLHPKRIEEIVNRVYDLHDKLTDNKRYSSLFACSSIKELMLLYDEFKKHNEMLDDPSKRLCVSAIFTRADVNVDEDIEINRLDRIKDDFYKMSGNHCETDDSFRAELVKGLKRSCTTYYNKETCELYKGLDIVLVVGIFLTGFDCKETNTLYLDKSLKYHTLLQAMSRTNRVYDAKKIQGNIVSFRTIQDDVEEAIKLFSGNIIDDVVKTPDKLLESLKIYAKELVDCVGNNTCISDWKDPNDKKKFIKKMRKFNRALISVKQSNIFSWDILDGILNKDTYNILVGQLRTLNKESEEGIKKDSILGDVDFCMELVSTDRIDAEYIFRLLRQIDTTDTNSMIESIAVIKNELNGTKNIDLVEDPKSSYLRARKELITSFLDKIASDCKNNTAAINDNLIELFIKFRERVKEEVINNISKDTNIPVSDIKREIKRYELSNGVIDNGEIRIKVNKYNENASLRDRRTLTNRLCTFIKEINTYITSVGSSYN